ncbi:MAG: hypothetical protein ACK5P6_04490 [Pseudobdellovibrionaceae bacterium]
MQFKEAKRRSELNGKKQGNIAIIQTSMFVGVVLFGGFAFLMLKIMDL